MAVVPKRSFLGKAAGDSPYKDDEEEVDKKVDWKPEECAPW
jgi:hypothetical protein